MIGRQFLSIGAALAFIGCATADEMPDEDQCGAAALQDRVGEAVSGTTPQDLTIGGEPVSVSANSIRVVETGDPMTMDLRLDRLTIEVDEDRNLVSARCV